MRRFGAALVIWLVAAGLPGSGSVAFPGPAGWESEMYAAEPKAPFNPRGILNLVYANRPDSALSILDSFRRSNPKDPHVLVLKAKVLRERLNDEDNNKDLIRRSAEPIHAVLDTAIALSNEALGRDLRDHKHYYYRGYAWLSKAQLYVLTKSYWSAGRAASRGKNDLERYLDEYPEDPDAKGTLGAYYYFADAIPGFAKIVAKLLFIPGGDREKGLELLRYSTTHEGVMSADWKFVMAAIDLVFEGNFERGVAEFAELLEAYPNYTRLAEPLAVVAPLYLGRAQELRNIGAAAVDSHLAFQGTSIDWNLVKRMRLIQAFTDSYLIRPAGGVEEYDMLIRDPPRHPDWVLPIALLNRAYLRQKEGHADEAEKVFAAVRSNGSMTTYHRVADTMRESIGKPMKTIDLTELDFTRKIYEGDLADAARSLEAWKTTHGEDFLSDFYTGDIEALRGDLPAARRAYERALARQAYGGDQIYQTLSSARIAEILGSEGRYADAEEYLKRAQEYCHANYLLDFLFEARQRYYQLLESGKLEAKPSLLARPNP